MRFTHPEKLNSVLKEVTSKQNESFSSYVNSEIAFAALKSVREGKYTFASLPLRSFECAFEIALICNDYEFDLLYEAFVLRATPSFYEIGFKSFLYNCSNERIYKMFQAALNVFKRLRKREYEKTIFYSCGDDIKNFNDEFYKFIIENNITPENFLKKYEIDKNSDFAKTLCLSYISMSDSEHIHDFDDIFPEAISEFSPDDLRPAIKNYTLCVEFEKIPLNISEAIYERLIKESKDETLGLSRKNFELIRSIKFKKIFDEIITDKGDMYKTYCSLAGNISNVIQLPKDYFVITFEKFSVLNNSFWDNIAYAFERQKFESCYNDWKSTDFKDDYWQRQLVGDKPSARDFVLGVKTGEIIELKFNGFDGLYSKDIMTKI